MRYLNYICILIGLAILILAFDSQITAQTSNKTNNSENKIGDIGSIYDINSFNTTSNSSLNENNNVSKLVGDNFNPISIDILSDRKEYTEFEDIAIWVKIFGNQMGLVKLILEEKDSIGTLIHRSSQTVDVPDYKFLLH